MTLLRITHPMTLDAFFAFTDTRPDEERWELIDGEPVLNASPSYNHQKIVRNLMFILTNLESDEGSWEVLPGLGVKLSNISVPVPDLILRPSHRITGNFCDDMMVAFEVLSPSTASRDLRWERKAYSELPTLHDYIVVSQDEIDVRHYARANGWSEQRIDSAAIDIRLEAVGIALPLASIYKGTGL